MTAIVDLNVNSTAVRAFINADSARPCTAQEFMEFWKATSADDRQRYGDEARALLSA